MGGACRRGGAAPPEHGGRLPTVRRSVAVSLAWVGGVLLLAGHLDFWRPQRAVLHFGWLPEELAWRLAWMFFAWLWLLFVCARVWRDELPPGTGEVASTNGSVE